MFKMIFQSRICQVQDEISTVGSDLEALKVSSMFVIALSLSLSLFWHLVYQNFSKYF